ncbi:phosphotransferase [Hamadaea sp. NPDC050747]|uniref:phosphotransferase n=1 Tax=Hamadaea sp. NPDC050747 TaxID=3155789 RepID=UPI0033FF241D
MTGPWDVDQLLSAHGWTLVRVLRDTTSGRTLAVQDRDGTMSVLKVRSGSDEHARRRHETEVCVYRALRTVLPVGWNTPTLLDAGESTLRVQYLPGAPIGDGRYPRTISEHRIGQVLRALTALHQWQPPTNAVPSWPYGRVHGLHAAPNAGTILTAADRDLLGCLHRRVWTRIEHGDPLASNMLCGEHTLALIDFEHTGWQPAGTDWALLDLLWSPGNPGLRERLAANATSEGCGPGYASALLLYSAHEIYLHRTVFAPADDQDRAGVLAGNLAYARATAAAIARSNPREGHLES